MRLIHKNQRGFTLIEMMLAIAVAGIITGGITMSIFQVFDVNTRSSNHMIAVKQVQNAGYWISHDTQMAQNVDTDDDMGTAETEVLTLAWVGWEYDCGGSDTCVDTHLVRYTYDASSLKLQRHQTIEIKEYDSDGKLVVPPPDPPSPTILAFDYITPIPTATMGGNKLSVTITASVGDAVETRTYEITPRPSSY